MDFTVNRINPRKLLHSKWTATAPQNRQKHFMVVEVEFDEEGQVSHCLLEAVLTRQATAIDWRKLKDPQQWKMGWV